MNARVNPARAGMIREAAKRMSTPRCKPRASGDDPLTPHTLNVRAL